MARSLLLGGGSSTSPLAPDFGFEFGIGADRFVYDAWGAIAGRAGPDAPPGNHSDGASAASPAAEATTSGGFSSLAISGSSSSIALPTIAAPAATDHGKFVGLAEAAARFSLHCDTLLEIVTAHSFAFQHFSDDHAEGSTRGGAGTMDTAGKMAAIETQPTEPTSLTKSTTSSDTATTDAAELTAGTVFDTEAVRMSAVVAGGSLLASEVQSAADPVFETRVAAAGDDVEQKASGRISGNVSDLELGYDGSTQQTVGLRFTSIDIPQGAIITSAYIQFQTDEVKTGTASFLIRGEDSDDAAVFTNVRYNVSSRPTTDASATWSPPDWTTVGEAGTAQRTTDLSAIVQEIVSRSGWAALNDMVFLVTGTGTRTAESFEGSASGAPLLHVEYLLPGPVTDPVAFNDPPDANPGANELAEFAGAGQSTGIMASASDPDPGSTVTYSIDDPRFAIDANTGEITRSGTGTLDFETEASITLTVTARSSDNSATTQAFILNVLDNPEQVAFNNPPDANAAGNKIAEDAVAGTAIGVTASAADPDAGSSVAYSIDDGRFAIDANTGVITRSGIGTLDAVAEPTVTLTVTATSSDTSVATQAFSVNITGNLPTSVTLVNTVLTSQWSTPSPDPSGLAYISHLGTLLISDGEVDEMSIFTGKNLYEMSLSGTLVGTLTTVSFSDEPAGVAYDPTTHHLFFADDTGTKKVYELNPSSDGLYNTSDDVVTSFRTSGFGSTDPEGLAYDANRGVLYLADGATNTIHTIAPGANGTFDGVPSVGGDDVVTSFATGSLGINDPEAVEYDPYHDLLYIVASRVAIAMVTTAGQLLGMLDISAANARKPAGLALAPSSGDPGQMSLYLADRGVDNDTNPNENDGKVYEFQFNDWALV